MKTKITIKLVRHQNAIADENYEVVSLSGAITIPVNGGTARAGDFITEKQAQRLTEENCYDITTTAKK